jgi:hypothetical protein
MSAFELLANKSRSLHGHRYVLPVAAWILKSGVETVSPSDVMVGLGGRADRPRVIEALVKLASIGALTELPRAGKRDPRLFERINDPYWNLVATQIDGLPATDPGQIANPPFG